MGPIWTIGARDSVLLDVLDADVVTIGRELGVVFAELTDLLRTKGVDYGRLRRALVPVPDRKEIALIFDTRLIDLTWYGLDIVQQVLPHLNRKGTFSILGGDLLHSRPEEALAVLEQHGTWWRPVPFQHPSSFYALYFNNQTPAAVSSFHRALTQYEPYLGYLDVTFASLMKTWLSTTLVPLYVKHADIFVSRHPFGEADETNENTAMWPLENWSYKYRSVADYQFDLFLSYKIERPSYPQVENDTQHSLSVFGNEPRRLRDLPVVVEPDKIGHLKVKKARQFREAGVDGFGVSELSAWIKERIENNYVYNIRIREESGTCLFNVILEGRRGPSDSRPFKVMAGLVYEDETPHLRLVTMF